MIVDCHTHFGMCWHERDGLNPANWLAILDRHGVDKAFLYPHAGIHRLDLCERDNKTMIEVATRAPDRLIPVATAWPQMGAECLVEVRRAVALGARGLKFHPWVQGFSTADRFMHRICEAAAELRVPIFFHDGTPCYSLSSQIAGLARQHRDTQIVLGHSGLLWDWRSAMEAARLDNVWSCLCGPHMRAMEIFCRHADPDRLLWGSDFGFNFNDSIDYRLNIFRRSEIHESVKEKILGLNVERLLAPGAPSPSVNLKSA